MLIQRQAEETRWYKLAPLAILGLVLCLLPVVFRTGKISSSASYWAVYFGIRVLIVGGILAGRRRIARQLPGPEVLDDVMYKAIAVGFAFFTIATIQGVIHVLVGPALVRRALRAFQPAAAPAVVAAAAAVWLPWLRLGCTRTSPLA